MAELRSRKAASLAASAIGCVAMNVLFLAVIALPTLALGALGFGIHLVLNRLFGAPIGVTVFLVTLLFALVVMHAIERERYSRGLPPWQR